MTDEDDLAAECQLMADRFGDFIAEEAHGMDMTVVVGALTIVLAQVICMYPDATDDLAAASVESLQKMIATNRRHDA